MKISILLVKTSMITIDPRLLLFMIVLSVIEIAFLLIALWDWLKQGESLKNRYFWLVIVVIFGIFGPILYFLIGPRNTPLEPSLDNDQYMG